MLNRVDKNTKSGIMNMKGKMSDVDVRKWYIEQDKSILGQIDTTKPLKEQAKQACELRNKYKVQARELMANQEKGNFLMSNVQYWILIFTMINTAKYMTVTKIYIKLS